MANSDKSLNSLFVGLTFGKASIQDAMKYEALRLSSFKTYATSSPVSVLKLAEAGFFCCGNNDEVQCYSCNLKLKDWSSRDDPTTVHKKYSPDCPFLCNNIVDNVPLASKAPAKWPLSSTNQAPVQMPKQNQLTPEKCNGSVSGHYASGSPNPMTYPTTNQSGNHSNQTDRANSSTHSQKSQPTSEATHDYRYERSRLNSFRHWPSNAAVRPEELAKSGFYYTGADDKVQCTFCRGILSNWEAGDQPEEEHRRHFGQCPFITNPFDVGNVTFADENSNGNGKPESNDLSQPDYCKDIVTERPVHQRYSLLADRLATYKHFPSHMIQTPEMFTRAGFFYAGIGDNVKCFFCDGGLRNWEPNDDPWTEHARWFPRCGYLRLCKGDEFVKAIQDRFSPPKQNIPPRLKRATKDKHPVDPKKLSSLMQGIIVKSVLDMGYDVTKVKKVVERRMEDLGNDFFPNAESLLDAISEYEDELKYLEVHGEVINGSEETNSTKADKKNTKKEVNDPHNVVGNDKPLLYVNEEDAKHLAEDVQKLKEERTCKVCMDEEVNVVFLKCGHLVCCANCAPAMRCCPICREQIRGTVRVFLS